MNTLKKLKNPFLIILILIILLNIIFFYISASNNYPNTIIGVNQITEIKEGIPLDQDEWHTLFLGMYRVYNKDFSEIRVGSTTRNLVILLSPLSVLYMNSKLGGEHTIVGNLTHSYSGYWYIERAVEDFPGNTFLSYVYDPNLQNFRFFIIFLRNLLFLLSVTLIASFFYKEKFKVTSFIFIILSVFNPAVLKGSIHLYTDMTNYLLFNFLVVNLLYFKKDKFLSYIYLGVILSLLISNTLGNLFIIPFIIFYILFFNYKKKFQIVSLISSFSLSFIFFNIYELTRSSGRPRGIDYIDQQLWNIWHYQTGHYYIEPQGLAMISKIVIDHIPYSLVFLLVFFNKLIENTKLRNLFILFSLLQFLIIFTNYSTAIYSPDLSYRNLTVIFSLGIFNICLLFAKFESRYLNFKISQYISIMLVIINTTFVFQEIQKNNVEYNTLTEKYNCSNVGGQDVSNYIEIDRKINFEISQRILAKDLEEKYLNFFTNQNIDCVFIKSSNSNKFLSNYLLLKDFELKFRHGDTMFFVNKRILTETYSVR